MLGEEIWDGKEKRPVEFTSEIFPWLRYPQSDTLVSLVGIDGRKVGWIGSCLEPGSDLEKIARRLNADETKRADALFLQHARTFVAGCVCHTMHNIDTYARYPVVSSRSDKLRVYFSFFDIDDRLAVVKIAACRKINEDVVLSKISPNGRANIR